MDRKSRTSRSAALEDTNEEVNLWKQICNALAKLETVQKNTSNLVSSINNIHGIVNLNEGIPNSIGTKLIDNYRGCIDLTTNEAKIIHDIIEKVSVLIALRDASEYNIIEQRRKKRKVEQEDNLTSAPKKAKFSSNGILTFGTSVAAKQPKQKDKNEEWILAVVISYHNDKNKYQVEDVDQDEFGQKQRYMLQPRNIIPIPDMNEVKGLVEISTGQPVLALYPGTTCFYRAKVISQPSKNKDTDFPGFYKVQFEDDNNDIKYIQPIHVLELPKIK